MGFSGFANCTHRLTGCVLKSVRTSWLLVTGSTQAGKQNQCAKSHVRRNLPSNLMCVTGQLQLRYEHDSSTIRLRFDYDSATTRYNTLRGFSCARIRDRIRESVVGLSCMLIDSSMHTAFTVYLYRPTLHRVCEYARNCLYKGN